MTAINTWTHLRMTYSLSSGIRLYVNGSLASEADTCTNYQVNDNYTTIILGASISTNLCTYSYVGEISMN